MTELPVRLPATHLISASHATHGGHDPDLRGCLPSKLLELDEMPVHTSEDNDTIKPSSKDAPNADRNLASYPAILSALPIVNRRAFCLLI